LHACKIMDKQKEDYALPELPYGYEALEPNISKEQLTIHHQKHHQAYVTGINNIFKKLKESRAAGIEIDIKPVAKELSFNLAGHKLHSLFWKNMVPEKKYEEPKGILKKAIEDEFGSLESFKKEFSRAAASVEGSGWATLALDNKTRKLLILQIEKHNVNLAPEVSMLLVLDVWEHAYYLDYKNDRVKFIDNFWKIINWSEVEKRLKENGDNR